MQSSNEPTKMWSGRFREPLNRTFEQWQRSLPFDWRLLPHRFAASKAGGRAIAQAMQLLIVAVASISATAQSATVTFYTAGSALDSALTADKHGIFSGSLFDGDQFLFLFQGHSFEKNQHRFVTITLPPGPHEFTATYGKDPRKGAHVALPLEAGNHYFLRANSELQGAFVIGTVKAILDQVSCSVAHEEIGAGTPLVPGRISPAVKTEINNREPLPACP